MKRRKFLKSAAVLGGGALLPPPAREIRPYRVGERVSGDVFFLDAAGERQTLASQVSDFTRLVYLVLFGGSFRSKPRGKRGELWCEDSVDDLVLQRAIYLNYADKGVTFVPVAAPPVYDSPRYGFPENVFLTEPESSSLYRDAVRVFIKRTEALKDDGTIPYDPVFYDPRFRLLDNPSEHEHVPAYGEVLPWQGRFKGPGDTQRYGTPTLWLLSRELQVLREPFFGNQHEHVPLLVSYTVRDVAAALDEALAR
jgi:hypothetical protein